VSAFAAGASITLFRLRGRGVVGALLFAIVAVMVVALLERRAAPLEAPDIVLEGIAFGIALPLTAYGLSLRSFSRARIDHSLAELARYGGNRRGGVAGSVLVVALSAAACGLLYGALAVIVTRAPHDVLLLRDLVTSSWIGALAGFAYGCFFCFGSQIGSAGGGRFWFLILDWVFGAGTSFSALPLPRAHVQNLLGAPPVLDLPQWSATLGLLAIGVLSLFLAVLRSPR
jgi:hypothetical protein